MQIQMKNGDGAVDVADSVFAGSINESLVHQIVTAYMAGGRAGTRAQKTRSQVRGGGAKPWRQKGTGRARAGTSRSPIWVGGGVSFAAVPQDHSQKVNRKAFRVGMRSIFSDLVASDRLIVVEKLELDAPRTRDMVALLAGMGVDNALLVASQPSDNLFLASRNLIGVDVCDAGGLDPVSLLRFDNVVMTVDAVRQVEEWLK